MKKEHDIEEDKQETAAAAEDAAQTAATPDADAADDGAEAAADAASKKDVDDSPETSVLSGKTIEEVIRTEAVEESPHTFSIARTLGGVIVARYVQRQIGVVLLSCLFIVIYISNRYVCQKLIVEIDKTESKVEKARFKATVCTSELTERSRESNVMDLLNSYGDSTLAIPVDPPYLIKVEE